MITTTGKDGRFWKAQIDAAKRVRQQYEPWWEANLKAYAPQGQSPEAFANSIQTNRTFVLTERKGADLFYQRPEVTLEPSPLMESPMPTGQVGPDGQPVLLNPAEQLQTHEDLTNEKLGLDHVNASALMDRVKFDIICSQATGWTEMGYESTTVEVEQQIQVGEEPSPGSILGLGPGTPIMETVKVPVPIHESCFWSHFSGKQALIPASFRSTDWEAAPWLGRQFELPLTPGNREKFKLPDDFEGSRPDNTQHYDHGVETSDDRQVFTGSIIWYKSSLFRTDQPHPEHFTLLILVDGIEQPVIHEDSPHQTIDPTTGGLTADSVRGNPIHPFSTRVLTDSAYPPSDGTMIRPLEHELNVFRGQMVEFRDANINRWQVNADVLPRESLDKIARSPIGGMILVPGEAFHGDAIKELPHGSIPRESFQSNDYIDNDLARTTGIDASGSGVQSQTSQTATAEQLQAANANARFDKERAVLLQRYVQGVTKYSTFLARYLSVKDAAQIVGMERAQAWDGWRKQIPCPLAFSALPDSALRVDQAVDRKAAVDLYSFLANDPYVQKGRAKLLEKLLRKHHINPTGIVSAPDAAKPEPAKISVSIKDESLSVMHPSYPNIYQILTQQGVQGLQPPLPAEYYADLAMNPPPVEGAENTQHGGKLGQQESLSKHHSDQTGAMQGLGGAPSPFGAGGTVQ